MSRHRETVNSRSFGRTGPAEVRSCGCDVLPWEPCQHHWDAGKSLECVIAEARAYVPAEPRREPTAPDKRLRGIVERARQISRLAREIESLLSETGGRRAVLGSQDGAMISHQQHPMRPSFEVWARDHLPQGYSLAMEEGDYIETVTRVAFSAFRAGMVRAAQIAESDEFYGSAVPVAIAAAIRSEAQ